MSIDPVSLAITAALTAANMALTMSQKIEGPRLEDLRFTSGDYNAPINMIWGMRRINPPIFWAEDLREVKRRRKTKGGKYNEYTYYGTWAVALASHEIAGIRRIWFDTHLAFDISGAGPVTPFDFGDRHIVKDANGPLGIGVGGTNYGDAIALYLGTEDQEPDPRMQATVEAANGEGSCPAYRGTAYIVFKDIPLEKLGNRIPQVSVEVLGIADASYPYEKKDVLTSQPNRLWNFTFSPDYSRVMWGLNTTYEIWDVAARSPMIGGSLPYAINLQSQLGLYNDGSFKAVSYDHESLYHFSADGLSAGVQEDAFPSPYYQQEAIWVLTDANGQEHWMTTPYSVLLYFAFDAAYPDLLTMSDITGVSWVPTFWFNDSGGNIWCVGRKNGSSSTSAYFYQKTGGHTFFEVSGLATHGDIFGRVYATSAGSGRFLLVWDNDLYIIDSETGGILQSRTGFGLDIYNTASQISNKPFSATTIWLNNKEISLQDLTTVRTVDLSDWSSDSADGIIYDPVNHALMTAPQFDAEIAWRYLDRVGSDGVTLRSICEDVADMVDIEDYDFTDLAQTVIGWSSTQGEAQNVIEPLLDAYDSDIRPHDFTIQGLKRTGTSTGTLLTERFVKADPRYSVKIRQAAELPAAIVISFADIDADQQPANVRAARPLDATDARGDKSIDLSTLALDADTARDLADRYFRRLWNGRREVENALTAQNLAIEAGDVKTLSLDGETMSAQLRRIVVKADDSLSCEWRYDSPSLALTSGASGATFDGREPSVIAVPLISKGFVLDIPLIDDEDNDANPLLYVAAAPYATGTWPGATVYEETGGEYTDEFASVASNNPATWGYATDTLAEPVSPWLWDRGGSVNISLQVGTLSGCTEADIDADPTLNLCLLGDELLNFTTATLEGDGTYTLSGFKRGRRGTEWACDSHAARDVFLLLDTSDAIDAGLSDVGTDLSFKAVTGGRSATGAFPIDISFTGASLKPYAPCHLEAVKDSGTGDWTLTWVRRTRVGGAWTSGTSIPLSETSEEYEVDILDAPGGNVVRTYSGLSSATATYSAADQTTDGGDVPEGSLYFAVYQISDAVDRGFAAEATA